MSPVGVPYIYCINALHRALILLDSPDSFAITNSGHRVRIWFEPEPDVMIVRGTLRNYTKLSPTMRDVLLVVEVSKYNLHPTKRSRSRFTPWPEFAEYWILNVQERAIEVYRDPQPDGTYASVDVVDESGTVRPARKPRTGDDFGRPLIIGIGILRSVATFSIVKR